MPLEQLTVKMKETVPASPEHVGMAGSTGVGT